MRLPASTLDGIRPEGHGALAAWSRRTFLAALALVVLAGVTGLLGARSVTSQAEGAGWDLRLTHAAVARAGLDVPWEVRVTRAGGLPSQVTLAVTGSYLDIYETQGFTPEPAETARDGDTLFLTFDSPPAGDTLVVAYDAYIQPSSQRGADGTLAVLDADDRPVVDLEFRTVLLP